MIDPTFNKTITLYNRYVDKSGDKALTIWHRTVLHDCFFTTEAVTQLSGTSLSIADSYICRIPEDSRYTDDYKGIDGTFTLKPDDVIVCGEVDDNISDFKGSRISDLLQKYAGRSFTVKSVSINTHLPYARHYRAKGV
jgi:hypothetical protein